MHDHYELFKPYILKARNMVRNMSVTHHDAEDIIQDALIRATRDYDGVSKPGPYFLKIVKNAALDMLKISARRRKHLAAYCPPESETFPHPDIIKIVDVLPEDLREPIKLMVFGGMSSRQAGAVIGISHETAIKRRDRGLEKLRDFLSA